jgi:hypothetical protein
MRRGLSLVLIGMLAWGASTAAGCGSSSSNDKGGGGGDDGGFGNDGSLNLIGGGDDSGAQTLVIQPQNATLNVTAPGATEQYQALLLGQPVSGTQWTIGTAGVGTIDSNGLFTASGLLGGQVGVTATSGALTASTSLTIHLQLTENPGNIDAGSQGKLTAGGTADPGFTWLYPYDQTVFPRDLPSPTLQFAAGADAGAPGFDAAFVHVTFGSLDYQGFYGPSALPSQIPLTATAWKAISLSAAGTDAVKVQVTKLVGGQVTGPITETWTIATGDLRGSIFYNSYNSALAAPDAATGYPAVTGAVLKLRPSEQQLTVVISTNNQGECHVCHAVAANGSIMEAADEPNGGPNPAQDSVYDLLEGGTKVFSTADRTWDFGAFTPNGTKFLRYGAVPWTGAVPSSPWIPDVRGLGNGSTDVPSALFEPRTGAPIPAPGLDAVDGGAPLNMMMPTFSPDGKEVAFNHFDTGQGHTIAVMDFDDATNTFSNLRDVATLPATAYLGWPTFTPDDQYLFFASGSDAEYDTVSDDPAVTPQPTGDLYIAHIPSKTIATADQLNGIRGGASYLPFPDDPHLNFEPTILPVASGGYYWVVFTTRRNYGNTINGDPYAGVGGAPSSRKKLWVAAVNISAASGEAGAVTAAADITHPAFYLDGQELGAGNMRAFWALDPCEQNGVSCETGDQCCSGFCRQSSESDGGVAFLCVTPPTGCSQESEACKTAADCCGQAQGYDCINGFCSRPSPQ